jgi:hypothetical protein
MHHPTSRSSVRVLDGRHELVLRGVTRQDGAFDVRYTVAPPLPDGTGGETPVLLILQAQDDLGSEYSDWGGVFGTSEDATCTTGMVTGQPGLPAAARSLRLRFTFLRAGEEYAYDLDLPV